MKILVAIANYGDGNRRYLNRLIDEYRGMPWDIKIVVLSDTHKALRGDVEIRVGLPDPSNPWSLPFAHRELFASNRDQYDLFIYSEDDTLVTARSIQAFVDATKTLLPNEIAGFLRSEVDSSGEVYVSSVHHFFRWIPSSVVARGSDLFAKFSNDHAACYMVTRSQLHAAIASGGFLVPPHEGRYDLLCAAATDLYTQCGFSRVVSLTRLEEFLLAHLPNKYIGAMGVPLGEVLAQVSTLARTKECGDWSDPLLEVETRLPHGRWSKNLYEHPDADLLKSFPGSAHRVLSVACGWGETEAALQSGGIDVTAIPVDCVFGEALRRRGVRTVEGPWPAVLERLGGVPFDCVLMADVLHLVPDPLEWLVALLRVMSEDGSLILSVPHTSDLVTWLKGFRGQRISPTMRDYGVHEINSRRLHRLLRAAGFASAAVVPVVSSRKRRLVAQASLGSLSAFVAERFCVRAAKSGEVQ